MTHASPPQAKELANRVKKGITSEAFFRVIIAKVAALFLPPLKIVDFQGRWRALARRKGLFYPSDAFGTSFPQSQRSQNAPSFAIITDTRRGLGDARKTSPSVTVFDSYVKKPQFTARARHTMAMRISRRSPLRSMPLYAALAAWVEMVNRRKRYCKPFLFAARGRGAVRSFLRAGSLFLKSRNCAFA